MSAEEFAKPAEAHPAQPRLRFVGPPCGLPTAPPRAACHVVAHGAPRQKRVILEQHADLGEIDIQQPL